MPDGLKEIPLFPLETVLFPHAQLQLHIYEERYRQMVHQCLENDTTFGIVLIRSGQVVGGPAEPYMIGTTVRVAEVHTYADGRMDIRVEGDQRFRIRRLDYSHPYLVGSVEPIHESAMRQTPSNEILVESARDAFAEFIERLLARPDLNVQVQLPPDPLVLSFTIANMLQIDNVAKQRLLETTDTEERLEFILPALRGQIEELENNPDAFRVVEDTRIYKITHEDLKEWAGPN